MPGPTRPDACDRSSPQGFKGHLDFDGSLRGIYSFWDLSTIEHTFSLHTNQLGPPPSNRIIHIPIPISNPTHIDALYHSLKSILVSACRNGFRGGAFAERVQDTSPLNDIMQFMYWSPVMTKEMRWFMKRNVLRVVAEIIRQLKEPMLNRPRVPLPTKENPNPKPVEVFGREFCERYEGVVEGIREWLEEEMERKCPLPDDVSEGWLGEFGQQFRRNYGEALRARERGEGGKEFEVVNPIRDQYGMTIKGWDMDIRDMFPVRFSEPVDDTGEMTWGPTQRDQFHIDDVANSEQNNILTTSSFLNRNASSRPRRESLTFKSVVVPQYLDGNRRPERVEEEGVKMRGILREGEPDT